MYCPRNIAYYRPESVIGKPVLVDCTRYKDIQRAIS